MYEDSAKVCCLVVMRNHTPYQTVRHWAKFSTNTSITNLRMLHHKSSQGVVKLILANGGHLGMAQKRGGCPSRGTSDCCIQPSKPEREVLVLAETAFYHLQNGSSKISRPLQSVLVQSCWHMLPGTEPVLSLDHLNMILQRKEMLWHTLTSDLHTMMGLSSLSAIEVIFADWWLPHIPGLQLRPTPWSSS